MKNSYNGGFIIVPPSRQHVRTGKIPYKYTLLLALGVAIVVAVIFWSEPASKPELQPSPPVAVNTTVVKTTDLQPTTRVTGRLLPRREARLHFELSGYVVARRVDPGQHVTRGQILLRLDDGDYRDAVTEARAQLAQEQAAIERDRNLLEIARRRLDLYAREVERIQRLGQDSLASQSNLDETKRLLLQQRVEHEQLRYSVTTAETRLQLKQAALNQAQRNLERTRLKAPFAGIVNAVHVVDGDYVTPSELVVELIDTDELEFFTELNAEAVASLRLGQEIDVAADGTTLAGTIVALQKNPDPATFTYNIRVRISGTTLLPGLIAHAVLPLAPLDDARVIPVPAVLHDEGEDYVFVVDDQRLKRTAVSLDQRVEQLYVVKKGLQAGDVIVDKDVAALSDGQRVTLRRSAPAD